MCTITLSYNDKDKVAMEKLAALLSSGLFTQVETGDDLLVNSSALLSSGLFTQVETGDDLLVNSSDASLFEIDPTLTPITKDLTPDELEDMIVSDIHSIYTAHHAV